MMFVMFNKKSPQPLRQLSIPNKVGGYRHYKIAVSKLHANAEGTQGAIRQLTEIDQAGNVIAQPAGAKQLLVKIVPRTSEKHKFSDDEFAQLIENETLALSRLYDVTHMMVAEYAYIIMEQLGEEDLFDMAQNRDLTLAQKAVIMSQTATQLLWMQVPKSPEDDTVIHRDLKSENIVVGKIDGQYSYPTASIVDPGMSLRVDPKGKKIGVTRLQVGTPGARPPEYVTMNIHHESFDTFSLGMIAFELFVRKIDASLMEKIKNSEKIGILAVLDQHSLTDDYSDPLLKEITTFIRAMLANRPQQRPAIEEVVRFFTLVAQITLMRDTAQQALDSEPGYAGRDFNQELQMKLAQLQALNQATATTTPVRGRNRRLLADVFSPPVVSKVAEPNETSSYDSNGVTTTLAAGERRGSVTVGGP